MLKISCVICNGFYWWCGVVDVGCATDELWSTPDHKRNEHDPKQRVGEVLPKFYSVCVYCSGYMFKVLVVCIGMEVDGI